MKRTESLLMAAPNSGPGEPFATGDRKQLQSSLHDLFERVSDRQPAPDTLRLDWLGQKFADEGEWVQFCYWLRLHHEGSLREAIDLFMQQKMPVV